MAESTDIRYQFLRGAAHLNDGYTGRDGEITIDKDNWCVRIHDGETPGGHKQANNTSTQSVISSIGSNVSTLTQRVESLESTNISTLGQRVQTLETVLSLLGTREYIDLEIMDVEIKSIQRELEFWLYRIQSLDSQIETLTTN